METANRVAEVSQEHAAQMHEVIARLARRLRAVDLPGNLTQERLSTLASIRAQQPVSISRLAASEMVSIATMSRMVSGLEAEGYIKRREHKMDRRGVLVSTTARGRRLYDKAVNQSFGQLISAISSLEPEQFSAIKKLFAVLDKS